MRVPPTTSSPALAHASPLLAVSAVLAILLVASTAAAQPSEMYRLEPEGDGWIHTHVLQLDAPLTYDVQDDLVFLGVEPAGTDVQHNGTTVTVEPAAPGQVTLRFRGPPAFLIPSAGAAPIAITTDGTIEAPLEKQPIEQQGDTTTYSGQPGEMYRVVPAQPTTTGSPTVTTTVTIPGGPIENGGFDWLALAAGLIGGMLVWALLVQRGVVQRRSRKQVVTAAAHTRIATEGKDALEARRRVLMAGLKELEKAKMNKEVDDATYDRLKAELKKETVAVMRALEESK